MKLDYLIKFNKKEISMKRAFFIVLIIFCSYSSNSFGQNSFVQFRVVLADKDAKGSNYEDMDFIIDSSKVNLKVSKLIEMDDKHIIKAEHKKTEIPKKMMEQFKAVGIKVNKDSQSELVIYFNEKGKKRFHDLTTKHLKKYLAIIINGRVIAAPLIFSPITKGVISITTLTENEAIKLADMINGHLKI